MADNLSAADYRLVLADEHDSTDLPRSLIPQQPPAKKLKPIRDDEIDRHSDNDEDIPRLLPEPPGPFALYDGGGGTHAWHDKDATQKKSNNFQLLKCVPNDLL